MTLQMTEQAGLTNRERLIRTLSAWAFGMSFFPSMLFVLLPQQTQPFYLIFALALLVLVPVRVTRLNLPFLVLTALLVLNILVTTLVYPSIAMLVIANGLSYLAPLVLFLALQDKTQFFTPKPLLIALAIWCGVGALQAFPFPGGVKGITETVGRLMFERFEAGPASETRGYSLLASEPSLSAPTVVLMILSVYFFRREGKLDGKVAAACYLGCAFLVALNQSGTIGLLLISILVAVAIHNFAMASGKRQIFAIAAVGAIVIGGGAFLANYDDTGKNIRTLDVAKQFYDFASDSYAGQSRVDMMTLLVVVGNQRVIPNVLAFGSMPQYYGIGHGVASWNLDEVTEAVKDYVGIRHDDYYALIPANIGARPMEKPQSYAALIAYDAGLVGFLVFAWAIWEVIFYRGSPWSRSRENRLSYILPGLVWLLIMMTSTMPAPWIMFLYAVHIARFPKGVLQKEGGAMPLKFIQA